MATGKMGEVIRHLRRTVLLRDGAGLTDGQLLERFVSGREEAALEALVKRHSPMVWGVCRRTLRNTHDAEDAFQATFLVLIRKAASVVPKEMVGNWLYGVAHQTAQNVRATGARRRKRERQVTDMPEPVTQYDNLWHDLQPLLDQELSRLPDKYRAAIVLCDLEGKTRKEAARQLGLVEGTMASRLARARTMLAKRLARDGLGASGGTLAAVVSQNAASASAPPLVVSSTIKAVSLVAAGKLATGVISAKVVAVAEGVVKAMLLTKLTMIATVVLLIVLTSVGLATLAEGEIEPREIARGTRKEVVRFQALAAQNPSNAKTTNVAGSNKNADKSIYLVRVPSPLDAVVEFIGTEIKEGEMVPPEKLISALTDGAMRKYRRLEKGDAVEEGQLLMRMDDRKLRADLALTKLKVKQSQADSAGAKAIAEEADSKFKTADLIDRKHAGTPEDWRSARLTRDKMYFDSISKKEVASLAEAELRQVQTLIELHDIRSKVSGVIANIKKLPGDTARRFETVLEIEIKEKDRYPRSKKNRDDSSRVDLIASQLDGIVQLIGTEIKAGEEVSPDELISNPKGGGTKRFRRLRPGDVVENRQLLAKLDDRLARINLTVKERKLSFSKAESDGVKAILDEAEFKVKVAEKLYSKNTISIEELRAARAIRDKMTTEFISKYEAASQAAADVRIAQMLLEQHEIRSQVSGVIRTIYKYPGEGVGKSETVFEIQIKAK
jgi:RNA polymerase sigma factor (sigma-70 family)